MSIFPQKRMKVMDGRVMVFVRVGLGETEVMVYKPKLCRSWNEMKSAQTELLSSSKFN